MVNLALACSCLPPMLNLVCYVWLYYNWFFVHNVHSPQHTYMSNSYRFNRLGLSHWDPYAVRRGGCLELYYCNMVDWFCWDSSLIATTNWFPSVLWHCWFGHLACKNRPRNDLLCVEWDVKSYTLTGSLCSSVLCFPLRQVAVYSCGLSTIQ